MTQQSLAQTQAAGESTYGVIMGDLVGSEEATSPERLHDLFNRAVAKQNKVVRAELISPLTITLGDEFQGLVRTLEASTAIMRGLRIDLLQHGIDCRFAVGVTRIKTPINRKRAWNMMGPGLAETRAILNEKRDDNLYRFFLPVDRWVQTMLDSLGTAITAIERKWTAQQLHDISALLSGKSVHDVARLRNVSAHTVYKVRGSGDFDLYVMHWHAIAETLKHLDRELGTVA